MSDNSSDSTVASNLVTSWKKDKVCLVCGDKALGYNFNAVSCESCKAFFRRNAHKTIRGRCQGHCEVTVESRSFCKRCRQQKCFAVGMRKDMILNAEQKRTRKQKIIQNRRRRNGEFVDDSALEEDEGQSTGQPTDPGLSGESSPSSSSTEPPAKVAIVRLMTQTNSDIVRVSQEAMAKLEPKHQTLMEELERAHELALQIPVKTAQKPNPSSATQFFNLAEGSVLRMVKLAKGITAFTCLSKDDQIALLKGAVTEIMMIRSAMYFDTRNNNWNVTTNPSTSALDNSTSQSPTTSGAAATRFLDSGSLNEFGEDTKNMLKEYKKFVSSLLTLCQGDVSILKLITALALFASDRPGLLQRESVQKTQEMYADLLESYIKVRFPEDHTLFPHLVLKLTDIRNINEIHSKMLAKMNLVEVEPLLTEVFGLGHD
ncbi:nuclear hormone receptor HR96-like isoform X2 [Liolophura sinensis]